MCIRDRYQRRVRGQFDTKMASRLGGVFRSTPVTRIFAKHDAWRSHPLVANNFTFDTLAPGFVNAAGVFGVFVFFDLLNSARKDTEAKLTERAVILRKHPELAQGHGHGHH
eukprot:TRINITY_DN32424_c0_g1_i1.p2 TRINITY_DN32424_c0_g1~~TRINITY_DN32424_c0_g1_i1.p2  ORF type:complete len:111 (-),score=37.46 TRINITY_DN32424_c0_g1_i1:178-510(-)